jgi:hypothetical protein
MSFFNDLFRRLADPSAMGPDDPNFPALYPGVGPSASLPITASTFPMQVQPTASSPEFMGINSPNTRALEQQILDAYLAQQDARVAAITAAQADATPAVPEEGQKQVGKKPGMAKDIDGSELLSMLPDGVAKIRKADGSILYTNVQDVGGNWTGSYQGERKKEPVHTPMDRPDTQRLEKMMADIRNAESSGLAETNAGLFMDALTEERAKLRKTAYDQAASTMGIEALEQAIVANETLDRRSGNAMFMGDSPTTLQLRQQLAAKQKMAEDTADAWLSRNLTYNQLSSYEKQLPLAIQSAVTRTGRMEDRRTVKAESAEAFVSGIPPKARRVLAMLNPKLMVEDGGQLDAVALKAFVDSKSKDKNFAELINAPDDAFPALAAKGNTYAQQVLIQDESAATGLPEEVLSAQFQSVMKAPITDANMRKYAETLFQGIADSKERDQEIASFMSGYNQSKATSAGAAQKSNLEAEYRLNILKEARRAQIMDDVLSWAAPGSELATAAMSVKQTAGQAQLDIVLAEVTKGKPLKEKVQIFRKIRDQVAMAAKRFDRSPLGALNYEAIMTDYNNRAIGLIQGDGIVSRALETMPITAVPLMTWRAGEKLLGTDPRSLLDAK